MKFTSHAFASATLDGMLYSACTTLSTSSRLYPAWAAPGFQQSQGISVDVSFPSMFERFQSLDCTPAKPIKINVPCYINMIRASREHDCGHTGPKNARFHDCACSSYFAVVISVLEQSGQVCCSGSPTGNEGGGKDGAESVVSLTSLSTPTGTLREGVRGNAVLAPLSVSGRPPLPIPLS